MTLTTAKVLENIKACMAELEAQCYFGTARNYDRYSHKGWDYSKGYMFKIRAVCSELSIFDWWKENLSMSQLKQMKNFVETAISLGFNGYVCFKVGSVGCSNGMWAYTEKSTDGFSPNKGDILYHNFVSGENYWSVAIDGDWKCITSEDRYKFTLAEVKERIRRAR